tara:strand:+ start:596 stop:826 length:231 start_codon:yes stop_codon:yes gene_type:complete
MRYCYTEAGKAEISLAMTIADLQELRAAVKAAALAEGSSYRIRHLHDDLTAVQHAGTESVRRYADELQHQLQADSQ